MSNLLITLTKVTAFAVILAASLHLAVSGEPSQLERVQQEGVLRVGSINGPETYYETRDGGLDGFEYQLALGFAESLGVELELVPFSNFGELLKASAKGKIHLAASGLIVTDSRLQQVAFTTPYMEISQLLVYRNGTGKPTELNQLYGKTIMVMEDSSEAERLAVISAQYPELTWSASPEYNSMDLIERVHSAELDYALVKSTTYSITEAVYPRARIAYTFPDQQKLAWAMAPQKDQTLLNAANRYLTEARDQGYIDLLAGNFFEPQNTVTTGGALAFTNRIQDRLPQWEELLKDAARKYDLDWMLLASAAYQESHWNPRARSRTGVRGMMMLTLNTARELGVDNRLDPAQSIDGGARYLAELLNRIPETVSGDDRMWMTLAAYNVGFGHLMDARKLAVILDKNPDSWEDVAEILPLLAKRKYYTGTRHGYARGWEPVEYVNNIRQFYTILAWHKHTEQRRLAMTDNAEINPVNTDGSASQTLSSSL